MIDPSPDGIKLKKAQAPHTMPLTHAVRLMDSDITRNTQNRLLSDKTGFNYDIPLVATPTSVGVKALRPVRRHRDMQEDVPDDVSGHQCQPV